MLGYTLAAFLFVLSQLWGVRLAPLGQSVWTANQAAGSANQRPTLLANSCMSKFNMLCELRIAESASVSTRASRLFAAFLRVCSRALRSQTKIVGCTHAN